MRAPATTAASLLAAAVVITLTAACGASVAADTGGGPGPATAAARPASSAQQPTVTLGNWTGVRPGTIYFSADGGNVLTHLVWTRWSRAGATAHGWWGYESCVPNCAAGTVTEYPVTVTLSDVVGGQFTRAREVQAGPHGHTFTFTLPNQAFGALAG